MEKTLDNIECVSEQVLELLSQLPEEDQLQCMIVSLQKLAHRQEINEDKITNGTMGEHIACKALGLTWASDKVHGCDAVDKEGKLCEIKTFKMKQDPKKRANINYKLSAKKKSETDEEYITRNAEELSKLTGGHYWVALDNRGTKYVKHWHIDGEAFAVAVCNLLRKRMAKDPKTLTNSFNLGCLKCPKSRQYHRIDKICDTIGETLAFPDRVNCPCK